MFINFKRTSESYRSGRAKKDEESFKSELSDVIKIKVNKKIF